MFGKTLGDQGAELAFDGLVDVGDEVDGAFLVDLEIGGAEVLHLHAPGVHGHFDCGREENRGNRLRHRRRPAS